MFPQIEMIERLRRLCQADARVAAAMLYGSFARGEGDAYSDIDALLYFRDDSLPALDQRAWLEGIAPLALYFHNEHGIGVAIFENLVRGEFHFDGAREIPAFARWQGLVRFPDLEQTILVDKTGQLTRTLEAFRAPLPTHATALDTAALFHRLCNACLFGANVLQRGEHARALEILNIIHGLLLRAARLVEGAPEAWINPATALEAQLSAAAYRRYQTCTAALEETALRAAYAAAWDWGIQLLTTLSQRHHQPLPTALIDSIHNRMQQLKP